MKKKLRTKLAVLLAAVCLIGLAGIVSQLNDYREGEEVYSDAAQQAELPEPVVPLAPLPEEEPAEEEIPADPRALELLQTDLAALREVNEDVVGWITIPDTQLSYPLMQGEDNEYYLNRTWERVKNSVGSVYLECQVSPDLSDFNTIVYAHRMKDGSMFGSLRNYNKPEYLQEHPRVYIVRDDGVYCYEIFAAHEVGVREITYGLGIEKESTKQYFIDFSLERSVIDTGVVPTVEDRILTMSTCTGNGYDTRWVVQARLAEIVS